jgi:hypothetical protein
VEVISRPTLEHNATTSIKLVILLALGEAEVSDLFTCLIASTDMEVLPHQILATDILFIVRVPV